MLHALTPGSPTENYYRFREDQNDGGYLEALVRTCQDVFAAYEALSENSWCIAGACSLLL
ncbi:hypothetical protein GCM10020331_030590 [Ectobacillus funiculus]